MGGIATKYSIGDKVWVAAEESAQKRETCPDCLGQCIWACTLPSGECLNIPCPTCAYGYEGSRGFIMEQWVVEAKVWQGTVGAISASTYRGGDEVYMLEETGVGTGRNYRAENLFDTKDEAAAAASRMAEAARIRVQEHNNMHRARKKSDRPGSLVAYLRREIAKCERDIAGKREHIERICARGSR